MSQHKDDVYFFINMPEDLCPLYEVFGKILLNTEYNFISSDLLVYFADQYDKSVVMNRKN